MKQLPRMLRAVAFLLLLLAGPAAAHENHQAEQREAAVRSTVPGARPTPGAAREMMQQHMRAMEERADADVALPQRLLGWIGRMHPFFVHFPIALFPIAWVALLLARRRGESTEIIRSLIIVGGASAVIAAAAGWLGAGFVVADREVVHTWHRWIGTGLGAVGALVALWAWRRRDSISTASMAAVLGLVTAALLVQGWLGGAVTHGMRHMMF